MSTVATASVAALLVLGAIQPGTALGQGEDVKAAIPSNLTKLRPIKGVAYDPKPSNFSPSGPSGGPPNDAYFDSDFFNSDFTAIWGDAGSGSRKDLETAKNAGLNLLHLYNWNPQRNHTSFLDAAKANNLALMIPINNFTSETIRGEVCKTCGKGYQGAFNIIKGIFEQIYQGGKTPHSAAVMWAIFNEYDINPIPPAHVAFVAQAILTLENENDIPVANRLPITVPVSDATFARDDRGPRTREQQVALERATLQWLETNPGKRVQSKFANDLPGAVLAILAVSNAFADAQTTKSYKSAFDPDPVTVAAIPADFWKTRFIASSNPFRDGPTMRNYLLSKDQFQSAFPGNTDWNTLPPLFFAEYGWSQRASGGTPLCPEDACFQKQADFVLKQLQCTNPLAVSSGTPQGYFLGSTFFQATFVDGAHFEAGDFIPDQFTDFDQPNAPAPAGGTKYRVDKVKALPVAAKAIQGYAEDTATCE